MNAPTTTYRNPVWSGYLADPFVLKTREAYFAFGTGSDVGNGRQADGRVFPVLSSPNLTDWTPLGGALEVAEGNAAAAYWAPEVAECNGTYYMYYARDMRLRVATSAHPAGPYRD